MSLFYSKRLTDNLPSSFTTNVSKQLIGNFFTRVDSNATVTHTLYCQIQNANVQWRLELNNYLQALGKEKLLKVDPFVSGGTDHAPSWSATATCELSFSSPFFSGLISLKTRRGPNYRRRFGWEDETECRGCCLKGGDEGPRSREVYSTGT